MADMASGISLFADQACVNVERAISDFRAGRPVLVKAENETLLAVPAEALDPRMVDALAALSDDRARLLLTPARLRHLGLDRTGAASVPMPVIDLDRVGNLALRKDGRIDAPVGPVSWLDEAAIELAQLSLVLPAVLAIPLVSPFSTLQSLLSVTAEDVLAYRSAQDRGSAHCEPCAGSRWRALPTSEFVVFRGGEGLRDQVAILVGKPDLSQDR